MLAIISVLARPGTPSRMQCPWQNRAISTCLRTSRLADDDAAELLGHPAVQARQTVGGLQLGIVGHLEYSPITRHGTRMTRTKGTDEEDQTKSDLFFV